MWQRQAQADLEEKYRRLEAIFNYAQDAILLLDDAGCYVDVNPAACKLFGYTHEEFLQLTVADVGTEITRQHIQQDWQAFIKGGEFTGEYQVRRKDGTPLDVEYRAVAHILPGLHLNVLHDISQRKQAEEKLRRSERQLAEGQRLAHLGSWYWDLRTNTVRASDELYRIFDLPPRPAETSFETFQERVHPDDRVPASEIAQAILEQGQTTPGSFRIIRPDGEERIVYTQSEVDKDETGQPIGVFGITWDITERQRAEEALRESTEFVANLLENSPVSIYITDVDNRLRLVNRKWEKDTGIPRTRAIGQQLNQLFPAEIAAKFLTDNQKVVQTDSSVGLEEQVNSHHYLTVKFPLRDALGQVTSVGGISVDITERRQAEQKLRYSMQALEESYQQSIKARQALEQEVERRKLVEHERLYLLEAERHARQLAETLRTASFAMLQKFDLQNRLNTLLEFLARLIPYDSAAILLLENNSLTVNASRGYEAWTEPALLAEMHFNVVANPILADLLASQQSSVIADTADHPHWERFAVSAHVRSWLGVPLIVGGEVFGVCGLDKAEPHFFTNEHVRLAELLAGQAAFALHNARLFEQVRAGRQRLETLSRRLIEVEEAERRHIARELHDEIGQLLTGLKLILEMSRRLPAGEISASLGEAQNLVGDLMARVRNLSLDLRPAMLDDLGLLPTLLWHFERYTAQTQVQVNFEQSGLERRFRPEIETAAYRLVQEALTNVARHAQVQKVTTRFWVGAEVLVVQVRDKGPGFDAATVLAGQATGGLSGMRERVTMLGGYLNIESTPQAGTCLTAELPLSV